MDFTSIIVSMNCGLQVPCLRQLVDSLYLWRPGINPRLFQVVFIADKVALRQVWLQIL